MKLISRVVLILALLFGAVSVQAADTLNGAGASFPYPVYSAWSYAYSKATGIQLNYQSIGSGGGIRQITERTVEFGASDAPQTPEFLQKNNLLQFPAVMGGVVPVVHIPGVSAGQMRLDSEAVCKIYLGEITFWDDTKIKAMNPKIKLPHSEITVVHRSDGSGTTAIFTTYLSESCPAWKEKVGAGTSVKWPVGIGGKGNEGVSNYVGRSNDSIGYVEFAYAQQNKLAHTLLKNPAGNFVSPNFQTFENAAATGDFDPKKDFYLWLVNAKGKDAWPIAGATFILLAKDRKEASMKTVKFYDWAFNNGDAKAKELVYIPLPKTLKDKIRAYWKANGIY
ncbi:MAG: phosphate ABC transporter substrate-binding protein PstS [Dissulfurispiraceae bacterium]|jgi:phosphate transport system substrate-binding protein